MRSSRASKATSVLATGLLAGLILTALIIFLLLRTGSIFASDRTHDNNTHPPPVMVEYVKPIKKWPPPRHHMDAIYPEEKTKGRSHHSGHFREKMAEIWDPHPEYEFKGFGRNFHLELAQNPAPFVLPYVKMTHMWENMTRTEEPTLRTDGCFYSGRVSGDPNSVVSVNLCHGMTGHIRTSTGSYMIEPAEPWQGHETPIKHALHRLVLEHSPSCKPDDVVDEGRPKDRRKRSLSREYYIELMLVADRAMEKYHGSDLENYLLSLMAVVSAIFKDASIGNPITVSVVKMAVIKDKDLATRKIWSDKTGQRTTSSASEMLRKFCEWQYDNNDDNDNSNRHHDVALLLTRENICRDPYHERCDTLGLAELGTMCDMYSSCALVRDNGLSAAFTIAHELGHVLNLPHDDDSRCTPHRVSNDNRVMARMLDNHTYPWSWSNCSRHLLTEFLDAGSGDCLLDKPQMDRLENVTDSGQIVGETFSKNRQCELVYGNGSKICPGMPVCRRLWCTVENQGCGTHHMPWADGTPCDHRHWCQKGICVPKNKNALKAVDGGWGPWHSFGECSRTCGGGVRRSMRHCNTPTPTNGGKYCVGQRVRYQSCNTMECPAGTQDFREQQCAKFNYNNFKIQGLSEDVKWVPKHGGISPEDRCKLYCRVSDSLAYYRLKEKVIDGTPCGPDNTYDMCINGACHPAGCDHKLNSATELDFCGVCGGNNSTCQLKKGRFNHKHTKEHGYTHVVRIPSGASNLDVRQQAYDDSSKDDHFIALRDGDTKEYILNGNNVVELFQKLILYGGTTLEYSGSEALVERVNSSRPLTKDLIIEVLSVGKMPVPPDIIYEYTVQKNPDRYGWKLTDDWTTCDKSCHGQQWRGHLCVEVDGGEEVALEMCEDLTKPNRQVRPCNTHCELKWEMWDISDCSAHCGSGERTISHRCVRVDKSSGLMSEEYGQCSHLQHPPTLERCTGPCDTGWRYSQWGPCSQTCGRGVRTRKAVCVDSSGVERASSECNMPRHTEEPCEREECPRWEVSDWTPCSVTCGTGVKHRLYYCKVGNRTDKSLCSHPPPKETQACYLDECAQWREVGEWSPCSVSCGHGESTIKLECSVPNGCTNLTKPSNARACHERPCSLHHENAVMDDTNTPSRYSWRLRRTECSVTCGYGKRRTSHQCFDNNTDDPVDNHLCRKLQGVAHHVEDCYTKRCPEWITGNWEPCPAICGEGITTRTVNCVGENKEILHDRDCSSRNKPAREKKCEGSCRGQDWLVGPWGNCSMPCGEGAQVRAVTCPREQCRGSKPAETQRCNLGHCDWKFGSFGPCNVTCGHGFQHLKIFCVSPTGIEVSDRHCTRTERRPTNHSKSCHVPCDTETSDSDRPRWGTTRWSNCSLSTCTKSRTVFCSLSEEPVRDEVCSHLQKPKTVRECRRRNCQNAIGGHLYRWKARKWSQCSSACGKGVKRRSVACIHRVRKREVVVDSIYCQYMRRPLDERPCEGTCGKKLYWDPGPWGRCSDPCSVNGVQTRVVSCHSGNMKVKRRKCPKETKPPETRKCEDMPKCRSCEELYQFLVDSKQKPKDTEYILYPRGENDLSVQVYCAGMVRGRPADYITVHPQNNFAMVYGPGLRSLHTTGCGDSHFTCTYRRKTLPPGFTSFHKLRVDLSTLEVIRDDWTYAETIRGNRVQLGEAGDCYSMKCLQGMFRLSLAGTNLTVSHRSDWEATPDGDLKITRTNDQTMVEGRCGGCCGMCRPKFGIYLDLARP